MVYLAFMSGPGFPEDANLAPVCHLAQSETDG
jgi:hypothetical protein